MSMIFPSDRIIKEIADLHWDWLNGFIEKLQIDHVPLEALEYVYKTAFLHGAKHQRELDEGRG